MKAKTDFAAQAACFLASWAAPALLASTATAQDPAPRQQGPAQPGRVVVTARKWEEEVQDVPQSISAVRADDIRDGGMESVKDAARMVPNVLFTEFSSRRLSFPYIRGVGSGQGDPAVTTFVDGVPQLTVSSTNLPLWDVDRVEFLRGPTSALYGRNTLAGAIQMFSRRPSSTLEFDSGVMVGNFNRQDYRLALSGPLVEDKLSFRLTALHSERDGYTKNDVTGNDVDHRDSWYGRGQLLWTPDDNNEVRYIVYGEAARDGGFVLSELSGLRANPRHIAQDFEGSTDRDVFSNAVVWNRYGDAVDLTTVTAVQDWEIDESADFDFSQLDGVRRFTHEEQTYLFQEVRLASAEGHEIDLGEDSSLRWLVGASGFYSDSDRSAANEFRPGGANILFPAQNVGTDLAAGSFDDWSLAAFAQLTAALGERLEITGALRFDYEDKSARIDRTFLAGGFAVPQGSVDQDESFREWLPRASVAYRFTDELLGYGMVSRGFKAGGFNLTAPGGAAAFDTETSWTYELGAKASHLDGQVEARLALFHIDWDDMQLSQFDATAGGYVTNAGESTSRGIEAELAVEPVENLRLIGALGFLDTEFDAFTDQFGQNAAGNDLPFAPEQTASVVAQYTLPVDDEHSAFARIEYFHTGQFYYDPSNLQSERYDLLNLRVGGGGKQWRVEGWIENTTDEDYVPIAFQINPADPTVFAGESAAPRTYGVTLRLTF